MSRDLDRLAELMSATAIAQLVDGLEVSVGFGGEELSLRVVLRVRSGRAQDAVLHLERALRNRAQHRPTPVPSGPVGRRPGPGNVPDGGADDDRPF